MKYYIFDLEAERQTSREFDTIQQAKAELCLLAGIVEAEIPEYLAGNCQYEIRAKRG